MVSERSHLAVRLFLFLLTTTTTTLYRGGVNGLACDGYLDTTSGMCYLLVKSYLTSQDANSYCQNKGGLLASVTSQQVQRILEVLLHKNQLFTSWLGAQEFHTKWAWLSSGEELASQGCHGDSAASRDLEYRVTSDLVGVLSPETCMRACENLGYRYAGLQAGQECYCSDTFGRYGTAAKCTSPCPKSPSGQASSVSKWCGGTTSNSVYKLNGAYGVWGYVEPNNQHVYQRCATIDYTIDWKLADEQCRKLFRPICDIPTRSCLAGSPDRNTLISRKSGYYRYSNVTVQRCYYIGDTYTTFTESELLCKQRDGKLAEFKNADDLEIVKLMLKYLDRHTGDLSTQYWIGLSRGKWTWHNGDGFIYSNWATDQPSRDNTDCNHMAYLSVDSTPKWAWLDAACNDKHPFICQIDTRHSVSTTKEVTTTNQGGPTTRTIVTVVSSTTDILTTPLTRTSTRPSRTSSDTYQTTTTIITTASTRPSRTTRSAYVTRDVTTPTNRDSTTSRDAKTTVITTPISGQTTSSNSSTGLTTTRVIWNNATLNERNQHQTAVIVVVIVVIIIFIILLLIYCCCYGGRDNQLSAKVSPVCLDARQLARHPANQYRGNDLYKLFDPHSAYSEQCLPFGDVIDVVPAVCHHNSDGPNDMPQHGDPGDPYDPDEPGTIYYDDFTPVKVTPKKEKRVELDFDA